MGANAGGGAAMTGHGRSVQTGLTEPAKRRALLEKLEQTGIHARQLSRPVFRQASQRCESAGGAKAAEACYGLG